MAVHNCRRTGRFRAAAIWQVQRRQWILWGTALRSSTRKAYWNAPLMLGHDVEQPYGLAAVTLDGQPVDPDGSDHA